MNRVLVVGCPGAGKSTAARRLAAITGLPLIHLDRHYWRPGWQRPDTATWRAQVSALTAGPRWIMDGNYGGTLDLRLAAADTVVHLDFPTWVCATRVIRRTVAGLGRQRGAELGPGCVERLDWPFFRFVLRYRRTQRARDLERLATFAGQMHRFTMPRHLAAFLAACAQKDLPEAAPNEA